ncbi:bifunctional phosphopantothenoylcysteine decarboxylase/phosphopantothenate--cysteine ligase CoaBC [Salipaludibacillus agaradhaerens]|uniref:bifunctional phosphopantothenoylcysteine decarboxylase/phosphopantothenate--cysteine ligase CoaBC n=1 Tax=Salipaludibacillus agaradhaerens TaxID=76935 RepID=UPI0021507D6F|nr:bifunctional phosphopantothenoylcysteine decarboxylase/phosphopantothenate--cysteine ligase CoaBC [Salipaludibacillus agaradhaerens]MCR6107129.1 bifunctional phosphopantothenoylcysteine decarboxylase/phosphopantothenate--cysteine ligase CoaBC [Salipaludibacillus agaradhaerens]MCR6119160.1 bifunctional phosphopantothenoylcysteine decarboxylase/phosphopantothenate--cysteine ligase CoaBC [Salipaludibacillus agaradhaerens]
MGKKILLCVSGGIAVFKAAALTSKLVQEGYEVKVAMTSSAQEFVTPLTFQALSRDHVYTDTFIEPDPAAIAHIDIADWADLVVVAPATANIIGKLANGIADDMLTTTLLAVTAPVMIAPAMNVHMYEHPAVKKNMRTLESFGYQFIEPDEGYLACGYTGKGRMAEPEDLLSMVNHHFIKKANLAWQGKNVVVTAGPTQEVIDPVRFFSNRSSGKMGYAIAEMAAARGAQVTLISGPVSLPMPHGVKRVSVHNAAEMFSAVNDVFEHADVIIKAAAVADYKPKETFDQKVKKSTGDLMITMERTEDILKSLGERKSHQILVGFAAESENIEAYAKKKLATKNLDVIAANSIVKEGSGFQGDTNELVLYFKNGREVPIPLTTKVAAANQLLDAIKPLLGEHIK